jgi:hypothetical protein
MNDMKNSQLRVVLLGELEATSYRWLRARTEVRANKEVPHA